MNTSIEPRDHYGFAVNRLEGVIHPADMIRLEQYIDIGEGHAVRAFGWMPDRAAQPELADLAHVQFAGLTLVHTQSDGSMCVSRIHFAGPHAARAWPEVTNLWQVESWDPLTIRESLQCSAPGCTDQGHITGGRWVAA